MQYSNSGYQNSFIQEHAIQEQRVPEQLHTGTCNTVTAGTRTASYRNMQYRNSGYQNSFIQEHANSVPYVFQRLQIEWYLRSLLSVEAVDCEHGTYGQDCDLKCSVKCENQTCHSITGRCLSCPPGWRGDYCEQECEKGTYGQECAFSCSVKCENQTCDSITGRCLCCPPGWRGDCCEQDCEHGTYGQECAFNCSVKCENQTCDSITGRCLSCPPGWRGDYCEQDCEHGTYGQECAFNCSVKCENQTCDSITGRCLRCPPGWRGDYCEQECIDTIFGPNCKQQCDPDCVPESTEIKRLCDAICGDSVLRSKILADPNAEENKDDTYILYLLIVLSALLIAILVIFIFIRSIYIPQSIPTVYDGEKVEKKYTAGTYDHACIHVTPWPEKKPVNLLSLSFLADDNPPRRVTHFQYTAWPEDGSDPCMWSLVDFEHKVFINTLETITLVHSGTDTTRSSVFIALHDLIRQAKLNQAVDFVDTVSRLRHDMPNTVQTFNLFSFETQLTGGVGDVTQDPKSKNRFFIIPDKKYQPLLRVDSPGEEGYINAVTLPSLYTQTKQFLTQLPMPTTVNDFWRLVTQYNVSLIVAFKSYEKDKSLAIYLPEEQGQPLQCGNIAVNVESVTTAPTWTEMKLTVKGKQTQEVTHLTFTERHIEPKNLLPNGAELSGLAYVVTTLMGRLDQENYLTVPVVVAKVKSIRPHAIPTLQQYILVYETMKLYTEAVISTERHRAEYSSTV
ncbi:uncharacterized protein LOC131950067 [Physella acuta]|uniref:uncharacterized protein LOC131950067 n=1 Tax=Physella acuta TaxID=109671 RepID=UPI0027DD9F4C|nr:uncharacterized protein LOC131950067 [Physella acuta]